MKSFRFFTSVALIGGLGFSSAALAAVDANAAIVKLRKSCTEAGIALNNCFTTSTDLVNWISGTRLPTASAPLTVEIGPGQFDGFNLSVGDVSFKGSGPDKTTIGNSQGAINVYNSFRLSFQDLKVTGGFPAPIYWHGGGSSTWTNVTIAGTLYGWTETGCDATTGRAKHYWFSSRISSGAKGYLPACSENWFFGSEIAVEGSGLPTTGLKGLLVFGQPNSGISPEAHVYGSTIRVKPTPGTSFSTPAAGSECFGILAVCAGLNGTIHIHGTGIDVIGNELPNDVAGLVAGDGGLIHANESSFNISTAAGGRLMRIINGGGHIHAPYLWEHIPTSPLVSVTGADITTVTTGTSDGHPHTIIYDTGCASSWYDTVDKACRP